jgi:non-ribosomal peptide synthetase component F
VHEQFEEQAELRRDEVGLDFEGRELSYGELNVRANQLAHYLRKMGVGPEVPVGICMQRSVEMGVGLLGIMKAGGAYVPLDPDYPAERLAFMVEDAQAPVVLTQAAVAERLPKLRGQVVQVEREEEEIRLDGAAQRSDEHACGAAEPAAVDAGGIPVERGGSSATEDAVQL